MAYANIFLETQIILSLSDSFSGTELVWSVVRNQIWSESNIEVKITKNREKIILSHGQNAMDHLSLIRSKSNTVLQVSSFVANGMFIVLYEDRQIIISPVKKELILIVFCMSHSMTLYNTIVVFKSQKSNFAPFIYTVDYRLYYRLYII